MHKISLSRHTEKLLIYGLFAVICHLFAVAIYSTLLPPISPLRFSYFVFPMLEHSLISFTALFIGALGIEYIKKEK